MNNWQWNYNHDINDATHAVLFVMPCEVGDAAKLKIKGDQIEIWNFADRCWHDGMDSFFEKHKEYMFVQEI